jgi:hypothetical protein
MGHIADVYRSVGQQGRRKDRQGGILGAGNSYIAR